MTQKDVTCLARELDNSSRNPVDVQASRTYWSNLLDEVDRDFLARVGSLKPRNYLRRLLREMLLPAVLVAGGAEL